MEDRAESKNGTERANTKIKYCHKCQFLNTVERELSHVSITEPTQARASLGNKRG
jgi:hypothetical protein